MLPCYCVNKEISGSALTKKSLLALTWSCLLARKFFLVKNGSMLNSLLSDVTRNFLVQLAARLFYKTVPCYMFMKDLNKESISIYVSLTKSFLNREERSWPVFLVWPLSFNLFQLLARKTLHVPTRFNGSRRFVRLLKKGITY